MNWHVDRADRSRFARSTCRLALFYLPYDVFIFYLPHSIMELVRKQLLYRDRVVGNSSVSLAEKWRFESVSRNFQRLIDLVKNIVKRRRTHEKRRIRETGTYQRAD